MSAGAIVPQKLIRQAKSRLAAALGPDARGALSLALLGTVCTVLRAVPAIAEVCVLTPDPLVRAWADARGVGTFIDHGAGLNAALDGALARMVTPSRAVLVIASDLPLLQPADVAALLALARGDTVVLAPSKDGLGTNAMLLPPGLWLRPAYGERSLLAHQRAAREAGMRWAELRRPGLALDIDDPADLLYAGTAGAVPMPRGRAPRFDAGGDTDTGPA